MCGHSIKAKSTAKDCSRTGTAFTNLQKCPHGDKYCMFKYKYKYLGPTPQVQYEYKYFKTVLEYKYQVLYICDDAPTRSIKKVYDMCIIHG